MKRTIVKITLLVAAVLLCCGAVMFYYKTKVAPPEAAATTNVYLQSVNDDIRLITPDVSDRTLDSLYTVLTGSIQFMMDEQLIKPGERDQLMTSFLQSYTDRLCASCNRKFEQTTWNDSELHAISMHIAQLRYFSPVEQSEPLLGEKQEEALRAVDKTITLYFNAKEAARVGSFSSLAQARSKIRTAREFAQTSPLNNCTDLVARLRSVPQRLEQAHFNYLTYQVERLRYWQNFGMREFDELATSISRQIDEYKNNAQSVYGTSHSVSELQQRAYEYYYNTNFFGN